MAQPDNDEAFARAGRRLALIIAGVGIFWILAIAAGSALGWTPRTQALFDLIALAGFGWAGWEAIRLWRIRTGSGK